MRGREYHGLVYSVTDDKGNKVGNPFKSSLFGKSVGYEAVQKKFARSKQEIKDRKLADMTKRTVFSVLEGTYATRRSLLPRSKGRASTPCYATRRKGASMEPRSSPTGTAACRRLTHGQGTFCQRLAGTLHAALCRTAADSALRSGGGTGEQARIFRRGIRKPFQRHEPVCPRRSGSGR